MLDSPWLSQGSPKIEKPKLHSYVHPHTFCRNIFSKNIPHYANGSKRNCLSLVTFI